MQAELNRKTARIEVRFEHSKDRVLRMTRVPGARFSQKDKVYRVPVDTTSVRRLKEEFGDELVLGPILKAWGRQAVTKERNLTSLSLADDAELERLPKLLPDLHDAIMGKVFKKLPAPWNMKRPARPFQRADISFMAQTDYINANMPGLGKTIEAIGAVYESGKPGGAKLIVAPLTSLDVVWQHELELWQDQPVFIMSGENSPDDRAAMLDEIWALADKDKDFWLVTTASMIRYAKAPDDAEDDFEPVPVHPELHDIIWDHLIIDEYHKMGLANPQTNMAKAANALEAERKGLLCGTPMGGRPIKLWGALHFLDPARFTSKWRWADEWLEVEDTTYSTGQRGKIAYGVKAGREDEFYTHLAPYLTRRTKDEVQPQLPPKQYVDILCDMTPKQLAQYETMASNAEIRIEEERLSVTSILAEYTRLKQFSDAHCKVKKLKTVDKQTGEVETKLEVRPTTESGKLPHLQRLLEERGITGEANGNGDGDSVSKVIIGSQFAAVVDMVHGWLVKQGVEAIRLKGSRARRKEQVQAFQSEDGPRVIVMTTTMGGVSITLNAADTVIIMDETWDPDDQEQLEDRAHGRGKLNNVTVYTLRSKQSIEQYIQQVTGGKADINRELLDLRRRGLRALARGQGQ